MIKNISVVVADDSKMYYPTIPGCNIIFDFVIEKGEEDKLDEDILHIVYTLCDAYYKKGYRIKLDYGYLRKDINELCNEMSKDISDKETVESNIREFLKEQIQDNIRIEYY